MLESDEGTGNSGEPKTEKMKQTTKIDKNKKKKNPEGIIFSGTSKTVQL